MDRDGAAHPAPYLGAVFTRRCARDVDFYTAWAGNCVLHDDGQRVMIDELNAYSASSIHASKHTKLLLAENPLTSWNVMDSVRPPAWVIASSMRRLLSAS